MYWIARTAFLWLLIALPVFAVQPPALSLYLDCPVCNLDHLRTTLPYLQFVNAPDACDVHVMASSQGAGGGGTQVTLLLLGRRQFLGMSDTLQVLIASEATEILQQESIAQALSAGLVRFLLKTPLGANLRVVITQQTPSATPSSAEDLWGGWIMRVSLNGSATAQQSLVNGSASGGLSLERMGETWKAEIEGFMNYSESQYSLSDTSTITNIQRNYSLDGYAALSFGNHWSLGIFGGVTSSLYSNNRLHLTLEPAIEYNLFPYDQAVWRQCRVVYRVGAGIAQYNTETIYDRTQETLLRQSLNVAGELRETWGSVGLSVLALEYLNRSDAWRLQGNLYVALRLVGRLSLTLSGNVAEIHDQLSLSKSGVSAAGVLLLREQLATNYSAGASFGISYIWGALGSSVVNPRFGR